MSNNLSLIGKRIPQIDTVAKATGTAIYTADLKLPGMLVGRVLRSPYPHAKILHIDKSKAEKIPGVRAIITAKDIPQTLYSCSFRDLPMSKRGDLERPDQRILTEKARYVGDPVAALAAVDDARPWPGPRV